jgi:membrane protein implicated in regulation of membrane protease activity
MQTVLNVSASLGPWNWFIAAVILFILETIVPGVHFLWFGLAAVIVGLLSLTMGFAWPAQLVAFALVSILSVFWIRRYVRPDVARSDLPDLNVRANQYIGRIVTVEEAIEGGRGKVRVGDTLWSAQGADLAAGSKVRVTGANGTVLVVAAV